MIDIVDIEELLPARAVKEICELRYNRKVVEKWALKLGPKMRVSHISLIAICSEYGDQYELKEKSYFVLLAFAIWNAAWNKCEKTMLTFEERQTIKDYIAYMDMSRTKDRNESGAGWDALDYNWSGEFKGVLLAKIGEAYKNKGYQLDNYDYCQFERCANHMVGN